MKMSILAASTAALTLAGCMCGRSFNPDVNSVVSPDGKNEIRLYSNPLAYEVVRDGVVVVVDSHKCIRLVASHLRVGRARRSVEICPAERLVVLVVEHYIPSPRPAPEQDAAVPR